MIIRQPIPQRLRILLGVASVIVLAGLYTLLAWHRHDARQQDKLADLEQLLAGVPARMQRLTERRAAALQMPNETQRQARLQLIDREQNELQAQVEDWKRQRDLAAQGKHPDAIDRGIPLWTNLFRDGLLRVVTPQGLNKDELWLWHDTLATAERLLAGVALGVVLSVGLGLMMGCFAHVEAFLLPPLAFLAKVPPTAMLAVYFVLLHTGYPMFVVMIAMGMLPTLAQTVYQSVKSDVPEELVFKAYTLGAHYSELIWNVIFRQTFPRILDAVRLQIGPTMVLLIAAEFSVAGEGFGYRLRLFYQRTDMTVVYVYLIVLGTAGLAVDYGLIWLRKKLCPWFV